MYVLPAVAVLVWTFAGGVALGGWLRNRAFAKHPPHSHLTCPIGARLLTVVEEIEFDHQVAGAAVTSMRCLRFGSKGRIYLARITRADCSAREVAHG
jgi:hypothetical protein